MRSLRGVLVVLGAVVAVACATYPPPPAGLPPQFPEYPMPEIPASLSVVQRVRDGHDLAWRRLQAGDLPGASRDFSDLLRREPAFYPALAGLGFVSLAEEQFESAAERFSEAIGHDNDYLPAWIGQAEAQVAMSRDAEAIVAMERTLALDPDREAIRGRLALVRFRQVQALIDAGRQARAADRPEEAVRAFEGALELSPDSVILLRELTTIELGMGSLDRAESHARRAVDLDAGPDARVALATVLEAQGRFDDAAVEVSRALAMEPRPAWRERLTALREKAALAGLPAEFGDLESADVLTRAQVAAFVGTRLKELIDAAPPRAAVVATDVRDHWAAPWILPVTRSGVMDVYPNHTFQPTAVVRRGDLAGVVATLLELATAPRSGELSQWRAARPTFADLPASNVFYPSAALADAASALTADAEGRFRPTLPATGADLKAAVSRIDQLAAR